MKLERSLLVNGGMVALALASAAALLFTREQATTSELEARANNLFDSFPRERLVAVALRGAGGFRLEQAAAQDGGAQGYELAGQGLADPEAAESLIRGLEMAAFLRRFSAEDVNREVFGLLPPRAELRAEFVGSVATLAVGKEALTPAGATYVEAKGEGGAVRIGLLRTATLKELLVDADQLRPRAFVPYGLSELEQIRFRDAGVEVSLLRGKGPAWHDSAGRRVRRDSVERLAFELTALKAEPFLELSVARAALDRDGALSATLISKATGELGLRVGSSCPGAPEKLIAERLTKNPMAACVAGGLRRSFAATASELSDTAAFSFHTDEVESLLIERDGKKLELTRRERGFRLLSPAEADVALNAGNRRLDALLAQGAEPVRAPDLATLGLAPPRGTARLRSSTVDESLRFEEVVELGRAGADGRLPVRRVDDGKVLLVPRDMALAYAVDGTLLRSQQVLEFAASEVSKLEVEWDGERELLTRSDAGVLELVEPRGAQHDGALALELLQALGSLETERWVADADDGNFGLQRPRARARITLRPRDGGPRTIGLSVGADTVGGAFAALDTGPGVFVLEKPLVQQLTTLLLTRSLLPELATVERVELERAGKTLVLARRGAEFVNAKGPELPPASISRALDALTNLRAEAALHSGPARPDEGFANPTLVLRLTPKAGRGATSVLRFGASESWRDMRVVYARRDGLDATYAVSQRAARELLDLF